MNLIKQIVGGGKDEQTIRIVVRANERGPQGEQGEPGDAATITAGNAYKVGSNDQPQVINTGTSSDAVFDFYIPEGKQGEPGKAATVEAFAQTLPAGYQAFVENTGTDNAAVFKFGIPQGAQGEQGMQGEQGVQGVPGQDGAVQYKAGAGIVITDDNTIYATGATQISWGNVTGEIENQTDLQDALSGAVTEAETAANGYTDTQLADYTKTEDLPAVNDGTLTITNNNNTLGTFTANSASNQTIEIGAPTITMTSTDPGEGAPLAANNYIFVYTE